MQERENACVLYDRDEVARTQHPPGVVMASARSRGSGGAGEGSIRAPQERPRDA
jgi:hypothetical protein